MDNPRPAGVPRPAERGVALILALMFTMIVGGICLTGTLLLKSHIQKNRTSWASRTQALQVARSGLAEAHSWLRRQTSQPVLAFAPVLDAGVSPPINDTLDEEIGLVREFRITGKTWARYEVWKDWAADPDPARLAWRQQFQCEDVSLQRGAASTGTIWRLRSVGYIYDRVDGMVPFDQAPNSVIASQVAANEYRRAVIRLPGAAAVNVATGGTCFINNMGRVLGGAGAGIYYAAGTGTPSVGLPGDNRVTGTPSLSTAVSYDHSYVAVFGMSYDEIRAMATQVVTTAANIPSPLPENGLLVIEASPVQFDASKPLLGTSIVIVKGNVTLVAGNNSNFNGLLYVEGNVTVRAPSLLKGSLLCTGSLTVEGGAEYATVQYDADVLSVLLRQIGNYKAANTTTLPRNDR